MKIVVLWNIENLFKQKQFLTKKMNEIDLGAGQEYDDFLLSHTYSS